MCHASKRLRFFLLALVSMFVGFSACSPAANNTTPALTATSSTVTANTLPGGGDCVKLDQHAEEPFTNVQVSHDAYLAHSEPMLVENPKNS
ncbi:MAG TPA: hypothetical protein VF844_18415, partial [Ktedonobacteraceae bacterium]